MYGILIAVVAFIGEQLSRVFKLVTFILGRYDPNISIAYAQNFPSLKGKITPTW